MSEEIQRRPLAPWTLLVLIWNGLGFLVPLVFNLPSVQEASGLSRIPSWVENLCGWYFAIWFLSLPFTTIGVVTVLWRRRRAVLVRVVLLYSGVVLALWAGIIMIVIAFIIGQSD